MSSSESKRHDREEYQKDDDSEMITNREAKRMRKTGADWLFLDHKGYAYPGPEQPDDDVVDGTRLLWTVSAVTSRGVRFDLSLRAQGQDQDPPPSVARLVFRATVDPATLLPRAPVARKPGHGRIFNPEVPPPTALDFGLSVLSSHDEAVLLHTFCGGNDNFVMDRVVGDLLSPPPAFTRLPALPPFVNSQRGMGIMRRDDGGYVLAVLEPPPRESPKDRCHVTFLSSFANAWRRKQARVPADAELTLLAMLYCTTPVLACGGRFWWVGISSGILSCACDALLQDAGGEQEQLVPFEYTPLPNVAIEQAMNLRSILNSDDHCNNERDRCVAVSGGRLRYVDMHAHRRRRPSSRWSCRSPPRLCDECHGGTVASWTLGDGGEWTQDHTVSLADVWKDESYRSTGLPMEAPEYPRVGPFDPDVVYFSIRGDGREFAVDLRTKKLKSCSTNPTRVYHDTMEAVFKASSGHPCLIGDSAGTGHSSDSRDAAGASSSLASCSC